VRDDSVELIVLSWGPRVRDELGFKNVLLGFFNCVKHVFIERKLYRKTDFLIILLAIMAHYLESFESDH